MSSGPDTTRNQMLQMPFDCAQRVRWNEERQATIRQWIDKYNHLVRAKYRYRLRCFPQEVDDGVQDFWMWFLIDAMELVYDPAIAKPEAYIQMLANRRAINYLRAIWSRNRRNSPIADDESNLPARPAGSGAPESDSGEPDGPWITDHLSCLVALNEIKVHEALVLVCKAWMKLGPAALAERHLETTLFQLCDLVASRPVLNEDEMAAVLRLLRWLRQQLSLPPESPWGDRPLGEFLKERRARVDARLKSRDPQSVLQSWLEQARRVYQKRIGGDDPEECRRLQRIIETRFLRTLRSQLAFIIDSLESFEPLTMLVWGWRTVLNMYAEGFLGFLCLTAADRFVLRMDHLLSPADVPQGLAGRLTGSYPTETVRQGLVLLRLECERVVHTVETRYKRSLQGKEVEV